MRSAAAYLSVVLFTATLLLATHTALRKPQPTVRTRVVLRYPTTPHEFVIALSKLDVDRFAAKTQLAPGIRADCLYAKSEARGFMVGVCTFRPLIVG